MKELSFHAGASVPLFDFADNGSEGAAMGVNAGFQYAYLFDIVNFGFFAEVDFCYNPLSKDTKKTIQDDSWAQDSDINYSEYLNIPITAGIKYKSESFFVNVGLAANSLKITDLIIENDNNKFIQQYKTDNGFGYMLGGGILFNKNISLEIKYFSLGDHHIKSDRDVNLNWEISNKLSVDILTMTLAYTLSL